MENMLVWGVEEYSGENGKHNQDLYEMNEGLEFGEEGRIPSDLMFEIINEESAIDLLHKLGYLTKPINIKIETESKSITAVYNMGNEPLVVTIDLEAEEIWATDDNIKNTKYPNRLTDWETINAYIILLQECRMEGINGKVPNYFGESDIPSWAEVIGISKQERIEIYKNILNLEGLLGEVEIKEKEGSDYVIFDGEFVCAINQEGIFKQGEYFPITYDSKQEINKIIWEWTVLNIF